MIALGGAEIDNVEELRFNIPLAALGIGPDRIESYRRRLQPPFINPDGTTFPVVVQSWILRKDGLNIVIDPCHGNGRERPALPHAHMLDTPYIERFEATGLRPEQVDFVFCTHLSCDHCGWNTRLRGDRWVPTFPNARYMFVRREVETSDPRNAILAAHNAGVFEDSVQPILDAGLAELIDAPHEIAPGIAVLPAFGHTLGHSVLRVWDSGASIYFTGDAFHHPLQVSEPELRIGPADDDPEAAIAVRRDLSRRIADERAVMFAGHFPAPRGGRVAKAEGTLLFTPL